MNAEAMDDLAPVWHALADANRRAILRAIRSSPRPVGAIAQEVGLSQQTTSHHLGVLRKAGLAVGTRAGTRHLFAVDARGFEAMRSYLDDFWPSKLTDLKTAIESKGEQDRD